MRVQGFRTLLPCVTAVGLALGAPAFAQDAQPTTAGAAAAPESFFARLAAKPGRLEPQPLQAPEQALADQVIKQAFGGGAKVDGWSDLGVDVREVMRSRPGGIQNNMMLEAGEDGLGPTHFYLGDRDLAATVPQSWQLIGRHGARPAGELVVVEVSSISPKLRAVIRSAPAQRGNGYCAKGGETLVYADPRIPATEEDVLTFRLVSNVLPRLMNQELCSILETGANGFLLRRDFLSDGRELADADGAPNRVRIVPAVPYPEAPNGQ